MTHSPMSQNRELIVELTGVWGGLTALGHQVSADIVDKAIAALTAPPASTGETPTDWGSIPPDESEPLPDGWIWKRSGNFWCPVRAAHAEEDLAKTCESIRKQTEFATCPPHLDPSHDEHEVSAPPASDAAGAEGVAKKRLSDAIDGAIDKLRFCHLDVTAGELDVAADNYLNAAPTAPAQAPQNERVRHVKRGTEYEVLGEAEAQIAKPQSPHNVWTDGSGGFTEAYSRFREGDKLTVYRDPKSGKLWCRFTDEFRDGRFVTTAPAQAPEDVLGYATRLAQSLCDKHYPNPEWRPLPDLYGVLTQIDNMTCGLVPSRPVDTERAKTIRSADLSWFAAAASKINDGPDLMSVYAAPEWECLSEDGQQWVAALVRETLAMGVETPEFVPSRPVDAGGVEATQIRLGEGLTDITRIDYEGKTGVLFRPRAYRISNGEPGELTAGTYWPVPGDVILWVGPDGPQVAIDALTALATQAPDKAGAREGLDKKRLSSAIDSAIDSLRFYHADGIADALDVAADNYLNAALATQPIGTEASRPVGGDGEVDAALIHMLQADNIRMRAAGLKLSEAALYVIREYDGTHRLSLAVAEWLKAIANEGGREDRYVTVPTLPQADSTGQGEAIGPRTVTMSRTTCEGCPSLDLKEWSFEGENDDIDSGTDAKCSTASKSISAYWSTRTATPDWCPATHSQADAQTQEGGR